MAAPSLTIGSLFSGIGGLELGLEWAGLGPVLWQAEADRGCRAVLAHHWPNARRFTDVRALTRPGVAVPELLCGGFPCQDLSQANPNGRGLDGERSGLWWSFLDVIDALEPRIVVIENVSRLVRRGLDVIVAELDARGFEVEATRLQAADVGAPHRRERLFVLGYADRARSERSGRLDVRGSESGPRGRGPVGVGHADSGRRQVERFEVAAELEGPCGDEPVRCDRAGAGVALGDPSGVGPQGLGDCEAAARSAHRTDGARPAGSPEPRLGRDADGLPDRLDGWGLQVPDRWPASRGESQHSWEPPRLLSRRRGGRARLRALGNAVVPHCAYVVGMRIRQRLAEMAEV